MTLLGLTGVYHGEVRLQSAVALSPDAKLTAPPCIHAASQSWFSRPPLNSVFICPSPPIEYNTGIPVPVGDP